MSLDAAAASRRILPRPATAPTGRPVGRDDARARVGRRRPRARGRAAAPASSSRRSCSSARARSSRGARSSVMLDAAAGRARPRRDRGQRGQPRDRGRLRGPARSGTTAQGRDAEDREPVPRGAVPRAGRRRRAGGRRAPRLRAREADRGGGGPHVRASLRGAAYRAGHRDARPGARWSRCPDLEAVVVPIGGGGSVRGRGGGGQAGAAADARVRRGAGGRGHACAAASPPARPRPIDGRRARSRTAWARRTPLRTASTCAGATSTTSVLVSDDALRRAMRAAVRLGQARGRAGGRGRHRRPRAVPCASASPAAGSALIVCGANIDPATFATHLAAAS